MIRHSLAALFLWLALAAAALAGPLRIVVISDLNGSYGSVDYDPRVGRAVQAIIALRPDLVISTGDMVAGQRRPHLSEAEVRAMWAGFHATVSDPLARAGIPLAVTPGNHDASAYHGFERERAIYSETWGPRAPQVAFVDRADYPFFYAFDLGGVRFVSLDATVVGKLDAGQTDRLRKAMRGGPENRIVFSHLPVFPFARNRETEVIGDPALIALMKDLGIDLHLSGHHHVYYPGAVDGVAVVSQACLGSGARRIIGDTAHADHSFTLIDLDDGGRFHVRALGGPGFRQTIDVTSLPQRIESAGAIIERLDLADIDHVLVAE